MDQVLAQIAAHVQARPNNECLAEGDTRLSFAEVDAIADNLAAELIAAGAEVGDVIVWIGSAGADRVLSFLATQKAGFVFGAPITQMGKDYVRDYLKVCDPKLIVVEDDWRAFLPDSPGAPFLPYRPNPTRMHTPQYAPVANDVISHISFTSGSTGMPKGSPRDRAAMAYFIRQACEMQKLGPDDTVALLGNFWNPTLFTGLYSGARTVCFDTPRFGAASLSEWLTTERATAFMAYPAIFRQIMATGRPLPDLRNIILIGEPLTRADAEAHARCTAPDAVLMNIYGSMEFAYVLVFQRKASDPINFDLMPLGAPAAPGVMRLIDSEGAEITEDGAAGEIQVISPHVVIGYLNEPELSADRFHIRPDGVRTMKTGDLAYRDHAGVYHTVGRKDSQTKIRGYNVRPAEIEIILKRQPGVSDATVGVYQTPSGIARLACHFIGGARADALRDALKDLMPGYMVPSLWMNVDEFPRTGTGKVRRIDLPDPFAQRQPTDLGSLTEDEREVLKVFESVLGQTGINRDDDFFDLGGDSLQAMRVVLELEKIFDRRLPLDSLVMKGATIAHLAERIRRSDALAPAVLRKGAKGPTLIAAHSIDGQVALYLELAQDISVETRIVGALAKGFETGEVPLSTINEMARYSIDLLNDEISSDRPFAIIGHSFSGALAFEMCREISARTGASPPLVLLDSRIERRGVSEEVFNIAYHVMHSNPQAAYRHGLRLGGRLLGGGDDEDFSHRKAWTGYDPQPLQIGETLLIHRSGRDENKHKKVWRNLIKGNISIEVCGGDHMSMLQHPHTGPLAQTIQSWLHKIGLLETK